MGIQSAVELLLNQFNENSDVLDNHLRTRTKAIVSDGGKSSVRFRVQHGLSSDAVGRMRTDITGRMDGRYCPDAGFPVWFSGVLGRIFGHGRGRRRQTLSDHASDFILAIRPDVKPTHVDSDRHRTRARRQIPARSHADTPKQPFLAGTSHAPCATTTTAGKNRVQFACCFPRAASALQSKPSSQTSQIARADGLLELL